MNIFVSDKSPVISAINLDDKRVIKMISESVQILSTSLYFHGVDIDLLPVRPTHINHPCCVWARETRQNYNWLLQHTNALMQEKRRRYPNNARHVYEKHIDYLRKMSLIIPSMTLTQFVNVAGNRSLGIDYTGLSDTFQAYQMYLSDRWNTDKRPPRWYGGTNLAPDFYKNHLCSSPA